jgi:hypothetical protein
MYSFKLNYNTISEYTHFIPSISDTDTDLKYKLYSIFYDGLFREKRLNNLNIAEIGTNQSYEWEKYFSNSNIYIYTSIPKQEEFDIIIENSTYSINEHINDNLKGMIQLKRLCTHCFSQQVRCFSNISRNNTTGCLDINCCPCNNSLFEPLHFLLPHHSRSSNSIH